MSPICSHQGFYMSNKIKYTVVVVWSRFPQQAVLPVINCIICIFPFLLFLSANTDLLSLPDIFMGPSLALVCNAVAVFWFYMASFSFTGIFTQFSRVDRRLLIFLGLPYRLFVEQMKCFLHIWFLSYNLIYVCLYLEFYLFIYCFFLPQLKCSVLGLLLSILRLITLFFLSHGYLIWKSGATIWHYS